MFSGFSSHLFHSLSFSLPFFSLKTPRMSIRILMSIFSFIYRRFELIRKWCFIQLALSLYAEIPNSSKKKNSKSFTKRTNEIQQNSIEISFVTFNSLFIQFGACYSSSSSSSLFVDFCCFRSMWCGVRKLSYIWNDPRESDQSEQNMWTYKMNSKRLNRATSDWANERLRTLGIVCYFYWFKQPKNTHLKIFTLLIDSYGLE